MYNRIVMKNDDIKMSLNRRFSSSRKKPYRLRLLDYNTGKQFIEMHMESRKDYDELVDYLIEILKI